MNPIRLAAIPLLCLFICISDFVQAKQNIPGYVDLAPTAQNFQKAMGITDPSLNQIDTILSLSLKYTFINQDSCFMLAQKAVDFSKKFPEDLIYPLTLSQLADAYRLVGEMNKAEALILQGKPLFKSLGIDTEVANADNKLGAIYTEIGELEKAITFYFNALETWTALKDSQNIFKPYLNVGWIFYRLNQYQKAEYYNNKAFEWAKVINNENAMMFALNNQGIFFHERSTRYEHIADSVSENSNLYRDSVQIFRDKALDNYEESLVIIRKIGNRAMEVRTLSNMAYIEISAGNLQEGIKLSKEAISIADKLGASNLIVQASINLVSIYIEQKEYKKAINQGESTLKLAKELNLLREAALIDQNLYESYQILGNFEKAFEHYKALQAYETDKNDVAKNKAITEVEEKYQNVEKEKQILELELKNEKIRKQRNYFFGGGFLLVILGLFGFQFNKVRKERNDKLAFAEALIFAQENERKRIARDLHDGVGQSLLLIKKQMEATFETTFENQEMIAETLEEVRSISQDLHPFQLEKFGLTAAIQETIQKVANSTDIFISKNLGNIDEFIPKENQIHIFRTVQEALNNVVKHSEATAVKISTQVVENEVNISVQDNGKGFDSELAMVNSKSLGLKTMFERIAAIGGKLTIKPGEKKGTIVEVKVKK